MAIEYNEAKRPRNPVCEVCGSDPYFSDLRDDLKAEKELRAIAEKRYRNAEHRERQHRQLALELRAALDEALATRQPRPWWKRLLRR